MKERFALDFLGFRGIALEKIDDLPKMRER